MPRSLFKYYRVNTLNLQSLTDNEVFLANPSMFNDPFDSLVNAKANDAEILDDIASFIQKHEPAFSEFSSFKSLKTMWGPWRGSDPNKAIVPAFSDSLKHFKSDFPQLYLKYLESVRRSKRQVYEYLRQYIRVTEQIGVASFTDNSCSNSMWAYYADNHRGICIEYQYFGDALDAGMQLRKVRYRDDLPYIEMAWSSKDALIESIFQKDKSWENENEFRLVHHSVSRRCIRMPVPIRSITFGLFTPAHEKRLILDLFRLPKFYQMNLAYGSRQVVRNEYDREWELM